METIRTKIIKYDNKSRKGRFVKVSVKGGKTGLYKYVKGKPLELYKEQYSAKHLTTPAIADLDIRRKNIAMERYLSKIKETGEIREQIAKGVGYSIIKDSETAGASDIKKAKLQVIKNLVRDQRLRDILTTEENFAKLKPYLEYEVKLKDTKGRILGQYRIFDKTVEEAVTSTRRSIEGQKTITKEEYETIVSQRMKFDGWMEIIKPREGNIKRAEIRITLRR